MSEIPGLFQGAGGKLLQPPFGRVLTGPFLSKINANPLAKVPSIFLRCPPQLGLAPRTKARRQPGPTLTSHLAAVNGDLFDSVSAQADLTAKPRFGIVDAALHRL